MAPNLAKKAGDASTVGLSKTCSNGKSRKNKHSNGKALAARGRI